MTLRCFTLADYDAAFALWSATEGMGLGAADSRAGIAAFLARNPELSHVLEETATGTLVGAVLASHDGRRGFLHHLAVARAHRGRGHGRTLVQASLAALHAAGIERCNLMVYAHHEEGRRFWAHLGWRERTDLALFQRPTA